MRNTLAIAAHFRKAGTMRDRRAPRGGTRNDQLAFLDEFEADQAFEMIEVLPPDIDPNAPDPIPLCECEYRCICGGPWY